MRTRCGQSSWSRCQEKEPKADVKRVVANCDAPNDLSPIFTGAAATGGSSIANMTGASVTQYGHVPGQQAHDVVFTFNLELADQAYKLLALLCRDEACAYVRSAEN